MLNKSYPAIHNLLAFAFFALPANLILAQSSTQCADTLRITSDSLIVIKKQVPGNEDAVEGLIELYSNTGGAFTITLGSLKDAYSKRVVGTSGIQFKLDGNPPFSGGTAFTIGREKRAELLVVLPKGIPPGLYQTTLEIQNQHNCRWPVHLEFDLRDANQQCKIAQDDKSITLYTTNGNGWFSSLLPNRIRQQNIVFRIENNSFYPARIDSIVIALKGKSSMNVLRTSHFQAYFDKTVPPKSLRIINLAVKKDSRITPDEYKGQLMVYSNTGAESLSVEVTLFRRSKVCWALLVLFLGIIVGWLFSKLKSQSAQLSATGKLLKLQRRISLFTDLIIQKKLAGEVIQLELLINSADQAEDITSANARLDLLESKVFKLLEWESITVDHREDENASSWRDAILEGNEEKIKIARAAFEEAHFARSAINKGVPNPKKNISDLDADPKKAPGRWKRFLIALDGYKVIYLYLRPIATIITLLVFAFLGLQEIYIDGRNDFGSDVFYDYLKLFLWGAVSNIVPNTLIGAKPVDSFLGKPKP